MAAVNKIIFEKNYRSSGEKSSVWRYFFRSTNGLYAECQICKKILKNSHSTTSLHNHLKSIHSLDLKTNKSENQASTSSVSQNKNENNTENEPRGSKKQKTCIEHYFKPNNYEDLESVVSKMTALDGLPFRIFSTSDTLRKLFKHSNYKLPSAPNSIKSMVIKKHAQLKLDLKNEITKIKESQRFSVSLDEWTSSRNKRYMNVTIHSPELDKKPFRNLGLSRISGRGTAENLYNILGEKLLQFGLSIEEDIACIVTDGASVMQALGKKTSALRQLCLAHGILWAVLDVLYKKDYMDIDGSFPLTESRTDNDDTEDSESESGDDGDGFAPFPESDARVPLIIYKDVISKVRKIVKYFKKSPTKTDHLNSYLSAEGKQLSLILDCKTRWSSLADMITRFLQLKDSIMKALIDFKNNTTFTSAEIDILSDLSTSLNIIKATVEAICSEDANLLTAEAALKFMISKLDENNNTICRQLKQTLKKRIIQRRQPEIVGTLKYLHNPANFYAESSCDIFINPSCDVILKCIMNIIKKYFPSQETTPLPNETDDDDVTLSHYKQQKNHEKSLTLKEQLNEEIKKSLASTSSASSAVETNDTSNLETLCRVQMALFDSGGPRNLHLNQVYNFLLSIPPTSVEAERVFSSTGHLCNKLRTSLNDTTLDCLSFLRSHYQRLNNDSIL